MKRRNENEFNLPVQILIYNYNVKGNLGRWSQIKEIFKQLWMTEKRKLINKINVLKLANALRKAENSIIK